MKKKLPFYLLLPLLLLTLVLPAQASGSPSKHSEISWTDSDISNEASLFNWYLYLLNDGAYDAFRPMFEELNINRIYQSLPAVYLQDGSCPAMVRRLAADGIEVVALAGEKEWGLPHADLSGIFAYIDALAAYNNGPGSAAPVRRLALDVETYTTAEWKKDPAAAFSAYVRSMRTIRFYANKAGLEIVQIIPVFFDSIDEDLFRTFLESCCDEVALMNYTKSTQVSAILQEVNLCRELNMRVETIFETKPVSEQYDVTENNTYFYDGFSAMEAMKNRILEAFRYEKLSVSYHHLTTLYHMFSGKYLAEIYVYTDRDDPTRNKLGQTSRLTSITLAGSDGSSVDAYLYNPNLNAEYPEVCFLAVGVDPDVTYTVVSGSDEYSVLTDQLSFTYKEGSFVDYSSIKILYTPTSDSDGENDGDSDAGDTPPAPDTGNEAPDNSPGENDSPDENDSSDENRQKDDRKDHSRRHGRRKN